MKVVAFSKAVEADLEEIDEYTLEHYGLEQAIAPIPCWPGGWRCEGAAR